LIVRHQDVFNFYTWAPPGPLLRVGLELMGWSPLLAGPRGGRGKGSGQACRVNG